MNACRARWFLSTMVIALAMSGASTTLAADPPDTERYAKIVADPVRTDQDHKMDASRHPAEFLPFTGAKPGMMALDVSAGAGYTSQLIALAVSPGGKLWAQAPRIGPSLTKRMAEHPPPNLIVIE